MALSKRYNFTQNTTTILVILKFEGFRKKIEKLAKEKDCELVGEWQKSLVNHLYWCAASTPSGKGEEIKAKWLSLDNHIHNKHCGHGKPFPRCKHARLSARGRRKKWFKRRKYITYLNYLCVDPSLSPADTKASEKLSDIITNTRFCSDVAKLSPAHQTSGLEAFHSVIIHFAPKSIAFSYSGILSR